MIDRTLNAEAEIVAALGLKNLFICKGRHSLNVSLLGHGREAALYVQASRPKSAAPFLANERFLTPGHQPATVRRSGRLFGVNRRIMRASDNRTLLFLIALMLIVILATLLSVSPHQSNASSQQSERVTVTAPQVDL
ncbi:MAG: hypothetical protein IT539_01375 [Bradyrhizobiaceae bacterium]|nr:hypothetical protein [Bradyrhizobiaceae bacterium]